ncbi:MAG: glycosyltransferase [Nitrospinae bacterium]|nr:glycosyltransferase [Nitrospinota bacterium]
MEISVVIPVYNAEKTILRCLESISSQILPCPPLAKGDEGGSFEIILIDNNSTDNSVQLIKDFISKNEGLNIKLIHELKQGSCAARNKGARIAKGKIIVNTDPDCVADKGWLRDIISSFDDNSIGAVAGNIYGFNPQGIIEKFLSIFTLRGIGEQRIFDSYNLFTGGFATANLSVKKDVFERIDGFDENINIFGEDHDLCARIYKAGYKIKAVPNAVIYHIHRGDLRGLARQSFHFGIAHSVLLKKHFPKGLFIELPRVTYIKEKFGVPLWINLNSLDKKLFFIFLAGYFIPTILILVPFYFLYHASDIKRRAETLDMPLPLSEGLIMSGLLFIKSFFITIGRIYGSFRKRVICI